MARFRHRRLEQRASRGDWAVGVAVAVVAAMLLAGRGELDFLASASTPAILSNTGKPAATPVLVHSSSAATRVFTRSSAEASLAWPTFMLAAAATVAAFKRGVGRTPLRGAVLQPAYVALRSLPVATLAASNVCSTDTGLHCDSLLSLEGCRQSFGSLQSATAAEQIYALPQQGSMTQASCARQPHVFPDDTPHFKKKQQHRRKAGGRQERRNVGARLLKKTHSEIPCSSFEPSKVPTRLQRSLQSHSNSKTAEEREAKTKADADSASYGVMRLQTLDIRNIIASYQFSYA